MAFWQCCGLMYAEFGCDAHKEKQNATQDTYFDTLMQLWHVLPSEMRIAQSKSHPGS